MEIFLIKLLQFILSISLLVLLHEGGHMVAAKLFGVKVEKFFIFFDVSLASGVASSSVSSLASQTPSTAWDGCPWAAIARLPE